MYNERLSEGETKQETNYTDKKMAGLNNDYWSRFSQNNSEMRELLNSIIKPFALRCTKQSLDALELCIETMPTSVLNIDQLWNWILANGGGFNRELKGKGNQNIITMSNALFTYLQVVHKTNLDYDMLPDWLKPGLIQDKEKLEAITNEEINLNYLRYHPLLTKEFSLFGGRSTTFAKVPLQCVQQTTLQTNIIPGNKDGVEISGQDLYNYFLSPFYEIGETKYNRRTIKPALNVFVRGLGPRSKLLYCLYAAYITCPEDVDALDLFYNWIVSLSCHPLRQPGRPIVKEFNNLAKEFLCFLRKLECNPQSSKWMQSSFEEIADVLLPIDINSEDAYAMEPNLYDCWKDYSAHREYILSLRAAQRRRAQKEAMRLVLIQEEVNVNIAKGPMFTRPKQNSPEKPLPVVDRVTAAPSPLAAWAAAKAKDPFNVWNLLGDETSRGSKSKELKQHPKEIYKTVFQLSDGIALSRVRIPFIRNFDAGFKASEENKDEDFIVPAKDLSLFSLAYNPPHVALGSLNGDDFGGHVRHSNRRLSMTLEETINLESQSDAETYNPEKKNSMRDYSSTVGPNERMFLRNRNYNVLNFLKNRGLVKMKENEKASSSMVRQKHLRTKDRMAVLLAKQGDRNSDGVLNYISKHELISFD